MEYRWFKGLLVCALLSGCGQLGAEPSRQAANTISVTGEATLQVAPDKATVQLGVEHQADSVSAAQKQADQVVAHVLALTDRLGVKRDQVKTTGLNIRPEYTWIGEPRRRELQGYVVTRQIIVQVNELTKLGEMMAGAVDAGVNQVQPPVFDHSDRASLEREALAKAAKDAKAQAQVLADALDVRLAGPLTVTSGSAQPPQPVPHMALRMSAESADASQGYETGQIAIRAMVNAVFRVD
jgi:hypothetical protein